MSSRPRSPVVKTPLEDDDLLSEILLRLPPQPSSLPRASLVCKRWHGLASDRGFSRRFRRHHRRNPPLLGFFVRDSRFSFVSTLEAPNSVLLGRFSLQRGDGDRFMCLGCRHGLVLIYMVQPKQMLVWDPVTGDQYRLAIPPGITTHAEKTVIHGAVLRTGGDAHFQVVVSVADMDENLHRQVFSCVYLSETGVWGDLISTVLPSLDTSYLPFGFHIPTLVFPGEPAALAGDSIYWMLTGNFVGILEFHLEKQSLAVIQVPEHMLERGQFQIVQAVGGGLGLLFLTGNILQLWKRKTDCDGVASWTLGRTIELNKLLFLNSQSKTVLGFAEENNVVFLWACGIVFMVHLESLQFKKLFETHSPAHYHPFESVYTAGMYDCILVAEICRNGLCVVGSSISYAVLHPEISPMNLSIVMFGL